MEDLGTIMMNPVKRCCFSFFLPGEQPTEDFDLGSLHCAQR